MKFAVFIIITIGLFKSVFGQQTNFIHFDDTNGLLDFEQYDLFQDKNHYIWTAGNSGIDRFNGKTFEHFSSSLQTGRSLTNIRQDEFGRIWCHDFTGKLFYFENDSLKLFSWKSSNEGTFPVFEISKNTLWIITPLEIQIFQTNQKVENFKLLKTLRLKNSKNLIQFGDCYYLSGLNCIYKINSKFEVTEIHFEETYNSDFLNAWCSFAVIDNKLLLLSRQQKALFQLGNKNFFKIKSFKDYPDFIGLRNINNELWLLTQDGAICLDAKFSVKHFIFKGIPISDLIQDYEGNYWFSSLSQGIFFVPDLNVIIHKTPNDKGFTRLKVVGGTLYSGSTDGSIYTFNIDTLKPLYTALQNKEVTFISEFNRCLLFGNKDFIKINSNKQTFNLGTNPPFKQLDQINDEFFLAADPGGLYLYSMKSNFPDETLIPLFLKGCAKKASIYNQGKEIRQIFMLINERTNCFVLSNNLILASTKSGLVKISENEIKTEVFEGSPIYATGFSKTDTCVYVATSNKGLLKYKNGIWSSPYEINLQLASKYIQKIDVENQNLWIASDDGILVYNLLTKKIYKIGKADGLLTNKINDLCAYNGKMYIATSKGLVSFSNDDLRNKTRVLPTVLLRGVNSEQGPSLLKSGTWSFPVGTKSAQLKFDVLSYTNQNNYQILYKLDNEKSFVYSDPGEYSIYLTGLQPGDNNFDIQIIEKYNRKLIYETRIKIYVPYAFYQTWSFKLLILVLFSAITFQIIRLRIKVQNKRNAELLEKERLLKDLKQSTLTSIKAQMNPHFIFNSLNTIQSYILNNDKLKANFYLGRFSDLMRKILSMSNSEFIRLDEEKEAIELYLELENMRLNGELHYHIELVQEEQFLHRKIPSMIIQPFIENAIKHGLLHFPGKKNLEVQFKSENDLLIVSIKDYGIGRKAAEKMRNRLRKKIPSFSSEANKKRLELLNENTSQKIAMEIIDLEEIENKSGTLVILRIPIAP